MQQIWEIIHLVCRTGIRTHSLFNMSLLPQPLDQGSRLLSEIMTLEDASLTDSPTICKMLFGKFAKSTNLFNVIH